MKPFIVFMAVLMIGIMGFMYCGDNGLYASEMNSLKAAAEECAATAALELDMEAFSEGKIDFREERARAAAQEHFDYYLANICNVEVKKSSLSLDFGQASVTAELYLEIKDIFHLPFLEVNKLCRISTYEYV